MWLIKDQREGKTGPGQRFSAALTYTPSNKKEEIRYGGIP